MKFLIWDSTENGWWAAPGYGIVKDLREAHRYDAEGLNDRQSMLTGGTLVALVAPESMADMEFAVCDNSDDQPFVNSRVTQSGTTRDVGWGTAQDALGLPYREAFDVRNYVVENRSDVEATLPIHIIARPSWFPAGAVNHAGHYMLSLSDAQRRTFVPPGEDETPGERDAQKELERIAKGLADLLADKPVTDGHGYLEADGLWVNPDGVRYTVHRETVCSGQCPIHNQTDHHMNGWPRAWDPENRIMVRICEHKQPHPDPDDMRVREDSKLEVHACCPMVCCIADEE